MSEITTVDPSALVKVYVPSVLSTIVREFPVAVAFISSIAACTFVAVNPEVVLS